MKKYNLPTLFTILGGTGNLSKTKLIPALFDLYDRDLLPDIFRIIGLSRADLNESEYQTFVRESILCKGHDHDEDKIEAFCETLSYVSGDFDEIDTYERLKTQLTKLDKDIGQCSSKLLYLAVPPQLYGTIFDKIYENKLMQLCDEVGSWSRLLVEKPFGNDIQSAKYLEDKLTANFDESQIYRIDHYLEKDAIENILSLRFINSILLNSWNNQNIKNVNITILESKNVSTRGSFYDGIGALRDVGQNHMLQILALIAMRNVNLHNVKDVRSARLEVLERLSIGDHKELVRAQYDGYKSTEGVDPKSDTETYFKVNIRVGMEQWSGVPFYLEAGKALNESYTECVVTFSAKDTCNCAFTEGSHNHENVLRIRFSPEQTIVLTVWAKKPGFEFELEEKQLILSSGDNCEPRSPEAYERVLHDCIVGDQTRFVSTDEVAAQWAFITPLLKELGKVPMDTYKEGSSGADN